MKIFGFHQGVLPLLISVPHAGTYLPGDIAARLNEQGRALSDTDWHVHLLYSFARELGASMVTANYSRYVVDLNRSPNSESLYASAPTSPVCPTLTFSGQPIYMSGRELRAEEIPARIERYWQPYHDQIEAELNRIRSQHGHALLWDAHSIASEIPGLFEGVLPEFNLGTREGASCPKDIAESLLDIVVRDGQYGAVLNGRFKGGYITQHYARPAENIYAVQLELSQRTYMDEANPTVWSTSRAGSAGALIAQLLARYMKAGSG